MKIEHIAIWTNNLERLKSFYENYFGAVAGERYSNSAKQFSSYFLTFDGGARLELMQRSDVTATGHTEQLGYAHLAMAVGSVAAVDALTTRLQNDGYAIADGPRRTGDGYYESVVIDPDGNRIELTAES